MIFHLPGDKINLMHLHCSLLLFVSYFSNIFSSYFSACIISCKDLSPIYDAIAISGGGLVFLFFKMT